MKISSPTRQIMGNKIIYNKDHNIVIASYNKYEIINQLGGEEYLQLRNG